MNQPIDCRGLSCPQPVILLKKALDAKPDACQILVDNRTALENTTRLGVNSGYKAAHTQEGGDYLVTFTKQ